MEGDNGESNNITVGAGSSGGATATSSRWNPTKEQINMLEGFYSQGIRTPSAEQIKQITSRLKAFGHIEGKNVFYWFQNHKARQRQKQKQEQMAYINRFLHRNNTTQPIFPVPSQHLPCPNVVCGPYYLPVEAQTGHHQQHLPSKMPPISNAVRRRSLENISTSAISCAAGAGYEPSDQREIFKYKYNYNYNYNNNNEPIVMNNNSSCNQETLPLFPLSPTGVSKAGNYQENPRNFDSENPTSYGSSVPCSSSVVEEGCSKSAGLDHQPFYDFVSRWS